MIYAATTQLGRLTNQKCDLYNITVSPIVVNLTLKSLNDKATRLCSTRGEWSGQINPIYKHSGCPCMMFILENEFNVMVNKTSYIRLLCWTYKENIRFCLTSTTSWCQSNINLAFLIMLVEKKSKQYIVSQYKTFYIKNIQNNPLILLITISTNNTYHDFHYI